MNLGSVEMQFKIQGLENQLKNLNTLHQKLNTCGNDMNYLMGETIELINGMRSMDKTANAVLKTQTDLAGANQAVVDSARKVTSQIEAEKNSLAGLLQKQKELLTVKQRVAEFNNVPSGFQQFSQRGTPLAGQSSPFRTDLANPVMKSWQGFSAMPPMIEKATSAILKFSNGVDKAAMSIRDFLTPSKDIQGVFSSWWSHFGRIGLGFGLVYRGFQAITTAAQYAFSIFTGGIKVMDDIRSSGAMVAGMLALVTKNGKTFADNYTEYFANFTKVIGRVTTLLPQYGLTMEQFVAGTRELAQFGVVVDNDNLKESIVSMKLINEIAANTRQDTRQIRQELQAFFSGQARMSDQFARTVNNSMPELAKSIEKIRNEGGTTQQMWAKLSTEMFKMEPSIKAANANLQVQHEVLKASLSVISAMALEATGLYDIWLKGLQEFNDSLFDSKGRLTAFGKDIYHVFFKAWEWTKEWGKVLLGVGQIIYGGVIKPFQILFRLLVDIKNSIIRMGTEDLSTFSKGMMQLLTKDFYGAFNTFKSLGALEDGKEAGLNVIQGFVDEGQIILKGLENAVTGLGEALTDNFKPLTEDQENKMSKALTGLLAPGGKNTDAAGASGRELAKAFGHNYYAQVEKLFTSEQMQKMVFDKSTTWNIDKILGSVMKPDVAAPKKGEKDTRTEAQKMLKKHYITQKEVMTSWASSEIEYWNEIISKQEEYISNQNVQIAYLDFMKQLRAQDSVKQYFDMPLNATEMKQATDLVLAEQERISTNWEFEFAKMKVTAQSFGSYLGDSFKGLFSSIFAHEITSFGDLFIGTLKSIQDAFSSMLSDMVSEYFKKMMEMQFMDNAYSMISQIGGGAMGPPAPAYTGMGSINYKPHYAGGLISEPVFGVGMKSGSAYSFAERNPKRVLSNKETQSYGSGSAPNVINFINESGVPMTASQSAPQFDGEKYVTSIIVKQMATNPSFRSSMRG